MRTARAHVASIVPRAAEPGPPVSQENSLWTWLSALRLVIAPACHSAGRAPGHGPARGRKFAERPRTAVTAGS
ncbi:hypothetical protein GCM10009793_30950 [Brachybacterium phenoliresistens]